MVVLGIDTATSATAVALRLSDGTTLERRDDPAEGEHPGHATRLLSFAHELLAEGGVGWGGLQRIAVGTGPGRFTGLRVGVATARGLARSLGTELVGVSSLHALARGAARFYAEQPLLAAIDARRGELFVAAYCAGTGDDALQVDFGPPLRPRELPGAVARAAELSSERPGCVAVGDGAVRYRAELEAGGAIVPSDDDPANWIDAAAVCALALSAIAGDPREVVPDYRRGADATIVPAPHAGARS
jgi:tRNA threonylcarbamoyladenosine biosynthesis protein TsaB